MKMHTFLSCLLLMCCSIFTKAQIINLKTEQHRITYDVNLVKESIKEFKARGNMGNHISNMKVSLLNGELVIEYDLVPLKSRTSHYNISLAAIFRDRVNNAAIPFPVIKAIGHLGLIDKGNTDLKKIVWENLISCLPHSEGFLEIVLTAELWGEQVLPLGVRCSNPPLFGTRQKIPYFMVGVIGIAGITRSAILKVQADRNYDNHLTSNIKDERDQFYSRYKKRLKRSEILAYSSLGLLVIDSFFFLRRRRIHLKRLKIFEDNCSEYSFRVYPEIDMDESANIVVQSKVQLNFTF